MFCTQKVKFYSKWICNSALFLLVSCVLALCLLNLVNIKLPPLRCSGSEILEPEISHPFRGDTITTVMLLSIIFFTPLIQIFVTEWFYNRNPITDPYFYQYNPNDVIAKYANKDRLKRSLYFTSIWYRDYFFGAIFMLLLNDLAKSTTNSPRPHFLDSCIPKFEKKSCIMGWLEEYNCTNTAISSWKLTDSHKSFPSGHSALAIFSAIFMIVYQCNRIHKRHVGFIVVLFLNTLWFGWAIFCSLSRFADRRHHPIDIAVGCTIGAIGASFTTLILSKTFKKGKRCKDEGPSRGSSSKICYSCANTSSATILDIANSTSANPQGSGTNNGSIPTGGSGRSGPTGNGYAGNKRYSLKRLLSTSSNMTQMSEIDEGKEMEVIPQNS